MKNKIAKKLFIYFIIILLVFTAIIGTLFYYLTKNQTKDYYIENLSNKAEFIAAYIENTALLENISPEKKKDIQLLVDSTPERMWIINKNTYELYYGEDMNNSNFGFRGNLKNNIPKNSIANIEDLTHDIRDLPEDSQTMLNKVFEGDTTTSYALTDALGESTVSVAVPIMTPSQNNVRGAVILYATANELHPNLFESLKIFLFSFLIALVLSFPTTYLFAIKFTNPLKKMERNALLLANGDYNTKNNIKQNDEVGDLANTLDILSDKLYEASLEEEKLNQLRQDFIANISHELRTPVTVIRGSLEGFRDNIFTDKKIIHEQHEQMLKESIYLQRLINDLLELSRIQNEDFEIDKTEISLNQLCDDTLRTINHIAEKKNIHILSNFDFDSDPYFGDYTRLKQCLIVILNNAIKFSSEGSDVIFNLNKNEKNRIISITNYDSKIPDEDLPYIFEKFYKSKNESNKEGTGLGLAIAKQICNRHNINLEVISNDTTTFSLIFN